jgi:hypothetical protein
MQRIRRSSRGNGERTSVFMDSSEIISANINTTTTTTSSSSSSSSSRDDMGEEDYADSRYVPLHSITQRQCSMTTIVHTISQQ